MHKQVQCVAIISRGVENLTTRLTKAERSSGRGRASERGRPIALQIGSLRLARPEIGKTKVPHKFHTKFHMLNFIFVA